MTKTGFIGVVPAVGKRRLVAQVSNLLYRRFPIGQALHGWGARKLPNAPQVGNLRYSRLEVCATRCVPMTKAGFIGVVPAVGKRRLVAQVSNLLYRRFPIGRASHGWGARKLPNAPQVGNLRYSRLEVCATRFRRRFNTDMLAECGTFRVNLGNYCYGLSSY